MPHLSYGLHVFNASRSVSCELCLLSTFVRPFLISDLQLLGVAHKSATLSTYLSLYSDVSISDEAFGLSRHGRIKEEYMKSNRWKH